MKNVSHTLRQLLLSMSPLKKGRKREEKRKHLNVHRNLPNRHLFISVTSKSVSRTMNLPRATGDIEQKKEHYYLSLQYINLSIDISIIINKINEKKKKRREKNR